MINISNSLTDEGIKIVCNVQQRKNIFEIKIPLFLNPVEYFKNISTKELEKLNVLEDL